MFLTSKVLVDTYYRNCFFPTPPVKRKLGLQIGRRLVIATHLDFPVDSLAWIDEPHPRSPHKLGLQIGRRLVIATHLDFPVDSLAWIDEPHPRSPSQ
jgi:hypothetical protein